MKHQSIRWCRSIVGCRWQNQLTQVVMALRLALWQKCFGYCKSTEFLYSSSSPRHILLFLSFFPSSSHFISPFFKIYFFTFPCLSILLNFLFTPFLVLLFWSSFHFTSTHLCFLFILPSYPVLPNLSAVSHLLVFYLFFPSLLLTQKNPSEAMLCWNANLPQSYINQTLRPCQKEKEPPPPFLKVEDQLSAM